MILFSLLRAYATWLLVSILVCIIGLVLTLIITTEQARLFLVSYVYYWNGLLVAMSGFGALHFAMTTYKQQLNFLISGILLIEDTHKTILISKLDKLHSFHNKQYIAAPVFMLGAFILYICGYPMHGFPKYYLWLSSSMMYYAGGLMLAYTLYALGIFHLLEKNIDHIEFQDNTNIVELENFNFYLSALFLAATIGLYFAFRGTLTANFTFTPPHEWIGDLVYVFLPPSYDYGVVQNLLVYPIVLFLPLALFAGFYMKLVLRKIYLADIKRKISEIDRLTLPALEQPGTKNKELHIIEVRRAAIELKEKIIQNNKVIPLVTWKDSPSIVLFLVVVLQFIWINDGKVKTFFETLLKTIN